MEFAGRYVVKFIRDDQLPAGQDWALMECDGDTYFVIKQSRISERALEDAWGAYRTLADATPLERRLHAV